MLVFCQTKFRPVRWISSPVNILLTSMKRRRESMWKSVFPVHEFDTGGGTKHLLKEQLKRQRRREHSLFSPPSRFSFLRRSPPSSRSWILKRWYGQQRKAATRDEIFFFFLLFIIIIFEVPTNAGGVSNGRTGRTLERAGSRKSFGRGGENGESVSLVMLLSEKSISMDRVTRRRMVRRMLGGNLTIFHSLNLSFCHLHLITFLFISLN